jgi:hypothetical protein
VGEQQGLYHPVKRESVGFFLSSKNSSPTKGRLIFLRQRMSGIVAYFTDTEWLSVAAIYSVIQPIACVSLASQKIASGMIPIRIFTAKQMRYKYKFCNPNLLTDGSVVSPDGSIAGPDGSNKRPKTESSTFWMIIGVQNIFPLDSSFLARKSSIKT